MRRPPVEVEGKYSTVAGVTCTTAICYAVHCSFCRCGFVNYSSVEEAKRVFDDPKDIVIDGNTLFINFASPDGMYSSEH